MSPLLTKTIQFNFLSGLVFFDLRQSGAVVSLSALLSHLVRWLNTYSSCAFGQRCLLNERVFPQMLDQYPQSAAAVQPTFIKNQPCEAQH